MYEILAFYLTTFALGIAFFPFIDRIFHNFNDRGYIFSRVLGALIFTYLYWIIKHFNVSTYTIYIIFTLILITGLFCFIAQKTYQKINWLVLLQEILLLLLFMSFIIFRSINPKIEGIEKIMDMALINSLAKTNLFPAQDVWYSSKNLNYYYFGQLTPAVFMNLLKMFPGVFYNVYVAYIFSIVGTASFSIGYYLTNKIKYAFLSVFLVIFAGNLDLIYKKIQLQQNYYYAEARSLIEYAITEFPSYSFLISDLHAHILNIPNVLLIIGILISIFTSKRLSYLVVITISFVLGVSFVTNSWDFLIYMPLSTLVINLKLFMLYRGKILKNINQIALYNILLLFPALILFLPFHLSFEPAVSGFGFNKNFDGFEPILLMFGALLIFTIPFLLSLMVNKFKHKLTTTFIAILILWGYALIIAPQIVFLKDIYFTANPPFYKANTVFKVWYQAWIVLSIAGTYSVYYVNSKTKNTILKIFLNCIFTLTILAISIYPINGVYYIYRTNENTRFNSINGYEFLLQRHPYEYQAITWINNNYNEQINIVEKPGEAYTTDSLFSSFTGNPTLVGWSNHQFGWRGNWDEIAGIIGEIEIVYTSQSKKQVTEILSKYNIDLIVIGQKEIDKYGVSAGTAVLEIGKVVYENEGVKLVSFK